MRFATLIALALLSGACGGPPLPRPGEAVRPEERTYEEAIGKKPGPCREVKAYATPLIVDWQPAQRADLEIAMKEGLPVLAYTCERFELLPECRVRGGYEFATVSRKEQLIQLRDGDELRVNLPLTGLQLGGELASGGSLDVGLVMVGKRSTAVSTVKQADLEGKCDGATHFLRRVTVGAFAMNSSTKGEVRAVADLFGAGGSASSASQKRTRNVDGDVRACDISPDAKSPPKGCAALIRLELSAISSAPPSAPPAEPPETPDVCPEGMVIGLGKCVVPKPEVAHQCDGKDYEDCKRQCDLDHPGSCRLLGFMAFRSNPRDSKLALASWERSCQLGDPEGCGYLASAYESGNIVAKDPARGRAIREASCGKGHASACHVLGNEAAGKPEAEGYYDKACRLGDVGSCVRLADVLSSKGSDLKRARELLDRACDARDANGCGNLGAFYRDGKGGVKKDKARAIEYFRRACKYSAFRVGGGRCPELQALGVKVTITADTHECVEGC